MMKSGLKIRILIVIVLIVVCTVCYWPFVQMKTICVEVNLGSHLDGSMHDKILEYITRLQLYPYSWSIHKGDSYTEIPFLDKDGIQQKRDIKFNWDNSITISEGTCKYELYVDSVVIETQLYPFSDDNYPFKLHETDDSLFTVVAMYDKNNNEIDVYRQKKSMPYKGKRVGFRLKIDGKVLVTGAKERFNY